ncbi:uncharacterized protein [Lepisosteus oculatus]|uniref:uncharacterized protein n=1 Tax=Lepisosteus oculatus TaxID=7918 RepID=UPI00371F746B
MSDQVKTSGAADNMCMVLFAMERSGSIKIGLPPNNYNDNFSEYSKYVGNLQGISHVAFSPQGTMFAVCNAQLYSGSPPANPDENWLKQKARCVGRSGWDQVHSLFFHPNGTLYVVMKSGELYRGPPPENEYVSWMYRVATKIGTGGWCFPSLFFDPAGILYTVTTEGNLLKGSPPNDMNYIWSKNSEIIGTGGWTELTHFMAFSPDGNLWCVSKNGGKIYTAPPPRIASDNWIGRAQNLGSGYNQFPILALTQDKTISQILSLDFSVKDAKILSKEPLIVGQHDCDNSTGSVPYTATFEFSETVTLESSFTHSHGFTVEVGASTTFKAGIPLLAANETTVSINASTTHNWSFTETERKEIVNTSSLNATVPPGEAVRFKAVVQKGIIDVPYTAKVLTVFGHQTTITGTWTGASVSKVAIKEEPIVN